MENHFTRKYEESFGPDLTEEVESLLGSEAATEAFFAIRGQVDMLVEEEEFDLSGVEPSDDWSAQGFVRATQELADLAVRQEKPSSRLISSLAKVMAEILGEAALSAAISKAEEDDDESRMRELIERARCLSFIKSGAGGLVRGLLAGEDMRAVAEAKEGAFVEVDENGDVIETPEEATPKKAKKSAKARLSKARAKKTTVRVRAEKIVTAAGTIRVI
jgi:hypothetical protein